MTEIILKTNAPDRTADILKEAFVRGFRAGADSLEPNSPEIQNQDVSSQIKLLIKEYGL